MTDPTLPTSPALDPRLTLDRVLSAIDDHFVVLDDAWRYVYVNEAAVRVLGRTREELLGRCIWELWPETVGNAFHQTLLQVAGDGTPRTLEYYYAPYGRWFHNFVYPLVGGVAVFSTDITVRKRVEAALAESEARFRELADTAPVFIWTSDDTNACDWFNAGWCAYTGRDLDHALGDGWQMDVHPDDLERVKEADRTAFEQRAAFRVEYRLRRYDGVYRWMLDTGVPRYRPDGSFLGYVGTALDIHDGYQQRQEILRRERQYASLAESSPDAIGRFNRAGELIYGNRALAEATGIPIERLLHRRLMETTGNPEVKREWRDTLARVFETGESQELDYEWPAPAGRRVFNARFVPEVGSDGTVEHVIVMSRDMTLHREGEARERQVGKMEAIGHLAGGLAHDFNNQLQAVSGFLDFVETDASLSEQVRKDLEEIRRATDRMASLTHQLLAFSRQQVLVPEVLDLDEAVAESQPMLQRLIGTDIRIAFRFAPGVKWTRADRAQLLQVLINLGINARDAMPQGGELLLATSQVTVEAGVEGPVRGAIPGRYVSLVVSDTGRGISPDHLAKLFEPFFTTKQPGEGTGLGLATVHGIVTQSRGYIGVESEEGKGTRFTILLPMAPRPEPTGSLPVPAPSALEGSGTILVVDDEPMVRQVIARQLRDHGFVVHQAESGVAALDLLHSLEGQVDLVLSDVVMPLLGGLQLAQELRQAYPALPVILMSGYPRDVPLMQGLAGGEASFLPKPIAPAALLAAIRAALDTRVGA